VLRSPKQRREVLIKRFKRQLKPKNSMEMKDVISELHNEFRLRREHIFKTIVAYAAFCGVTIGWVTTSSPLYGIPMYFLIGLIIFFSIVGVFNGLGVSKSQSNTAKTIVSINTDLGLFDNYFPKEWKNWGNTREWWYIIGYIGLGAVTSYVIFFNGDIKHRTYQVLAIDGLNVRQEGKINSPIVKVLRKGELVYSISNKGGWMDGSRSKW